VDTKEFFMQRFLLCAALGCFFLAGCHASSDKEGPRVSLLADVKVTKPPLRTILRTVEQPGIIQSYEKTAIYPKISGYVKKWYVDIGDRVKKDEPLLDLYVPELVEDLQQKKSLVKLDEAAVVQADKWVLVAQSNVETAKSLIEEAKANKRRTEADVARWESEHERIKVMVKQDVVNKQIQDETLRQLSSSRALLEQATSAVKTKESQRLSADASLDKAKADLEAAKAKVAVAKSDEKRVQALLSYTLVTAPYDAIVTTRNVSTGDFVLPATGDPSRGTDATGQSAEHATPLYVLSRSDVLMFVVGVPETDSPYVNVGSKAILHIPALAGKEIEAKVTRLSWSLNNESRTLRAEIDLYSPDPTIRPGMYAYGSILIERSNVRAVPLNAIIAIGNQPCCYCVVAGKAVRTPVQVGVTDGSWIEVIKKKMPSVGTGEPEWVDFTGSEMVVSSGNLTELVDGQAVTIKE
jgi:HlyD family secretion protein